jgi:hypothetical protein
MGMRTQYERMESNMNTVAELLEVLSSYGITQCDECEIWGQAMNIEENSGLMMCPNCYEEEANQ